MTIAGAFENPPRAGFLCLMQRLLADFINQSYLYVTPLSTGKRHAKSTVYDC